MKSEISEYPACYLFKFSHHTRTVLKSKIYQIPLKWQTLQKSLQAPIEGIKSSPLIWEATKQIKSSQIEATKQIKSSQIEATKKKSFQWGAPSKGPSNKGHKSTKS